MHGLFSCLAAVLLPLFLLSGCTSQTGGSAGGGPLPQDPGTPPVDPGGTVQPQGVVFPQGEWTWMSGSNLISQAASWGSLGVPDPTNRPSSRYGQAMWSDSSGNLFLFGGMGYAGTDAFDQVLLNDLWKFDGSGWIWVSGTSARWDSGSYGTLGVADPGNRPPARKGAFSWVDGSDNLWLFGGDWRFLKTPGDVSSHQNRRGDLWKYDGVNWTWVSGSAGLDEAPVCGTKGAADPANRPGARSKGASWTDPEGNLWLFGGCPKPLWVSAEYWREQFRNDLWKFDGSDWTWVSGSDLNNQKGVYGSKGEADPANSPGARRDPVSWTDGSGNLWLFGGVGYDVAGSLHSLNDLWKFDGNDWTWVAGSDHVRQAAAYGTKGVPAPWNCPGAGEGGVGWTDRSGNLWLLAGNGDLWVFDGQNWTWVGGQQVVDGVPQLAYGEMGASAPSNWPQGRWGSRGCATPSGDFWLYGGNGYDIQQWQGLLCDLWRYRPAKPQAGGSAASGGVVPPGDAPGDWSWVGGPQAGNIAGLFGTQGVSNPENNPGSRENALTWTDRLGNLWLFGGAGYDGAGNLTSLNDLWKFNGAGWAWVKGTPGSAPGAKGPFGVYGEKGVSGAAQTPGARSGAVSWTDSSGNLWMFGGVGYGSSAYPWSTYQNDLWKFDGSDWTWMAGNASNRWYSTGRDGDGRLVYRWSGSPSGNIGGYYGTQGEAGPSNYPGARSNAVSWTDNDGNFWLFGGKGPMYPGTSERDPGRYVFFNDLWKFDGSNWTWVGGATVTNRNGSYGAKGVADAGNSPGARSLARSWTDPAGNLWLYGGYGYAAANTTRPMGLSDLWKFDGANWTWVSGSDLPEQGPFFGTKGAPAASVTPGTGLFDANWVDGDGNLWLFAGYSRDDLWRFDGTNWAWMRGSVDLYPLPTFGVKGAGAGSNNPGARGGSSCWNGLDGRFWLFGGHDIQPSGYTLRNDLWCYQP